jgi:hypothetical protein
MCAGATEECIQRIGQEKAAERKGILKKREEGLVRTDKIQALAQSIPNQTLGDFRMESIPLCGKLCLSATLGGDDCSKSVFRLYCTESEP